MRMLVIALQYTTHTSPLSVGIGISSTQLKPLSTQLKSSTQNTLTLSYMYPGTGSSHALSFNPKPLSSRHANVGTPLNHLNALI